VEVSDAGPGIPWEERERVFIKFQRLSEDSFGTGLGLSIAQAATSAQGGHISIQDSPLGGARFVMLVPNLASGGTNSAS
jgi:signal transduction histidine kinase